MRAAADGEDKTANGAAMEGFASVRGSNAAVWTSDLDICADREGKRKSGPPPLKKRGKPQTQGATEARSRGVPVGRSHPTHLAMRSSTTSS